MFIYPEKDSSASTCPTNVTSHHRWKDVTKALEEKGLSKAFEQGVEGDAEWSGICVWSATKKRYIPVYF